MMLEQALLLRRDVALHLGLVGARASARVTRSCFILSRMVPTLVSAAVATPTTDEPRLSASVTADRALVSDFMVVEIDQ